MSSPYPLAARRQQQDPDPVRSPSGDQPTLQAHALEQLHYIRSTLESSGTFTAVSGRGVIVMGLIALAAGGLSLWFNQGRHWLAIWLIAGVLGFLAGGWSLWRKARSDGVKLSCGVGRRFLFSLTPPLLAGGALSLALYQTDTLALIPGSWLLLYGVAVTTAGAFSVRAVPGMGIAFMILGLVTLALPAAWHNLSLLLGFGGLHVVFGTIIVKNYGG